jgi:hypothetical protein
LFSLLLLRVLEVFACHHCHSVTGGKSAFVDAARA